MVNRILSIVGWIGTGLVLVAVVIKFGLRSAAGDQWATYLAWAGLVCVLAYVLSLVNWSRRQARFGTLAATSILVVLGILVAINYIGTRQNKRWDFTVNKQFSLADQSRNVVSKLDAPLQIQVFAQEQDFSRYQDKLKEYEYSSKKISTEYVDPARKPVVAKQAGVQQDGTIVFNYKGRTERITTDTEQDITNGIIKVVTGQQRKIYFTQGHGEKETTSAQRDGYNAIAAAIGRENYSLDKLVIAQKGSVPDDAAAIVVAGPKDDFLPNEIDALKKYLDNNGKLLLELDPPEKADSPPLTGLIALAHDWGIDVGNDVVIDLQSRVGSAAIPVAANYPQHAITERFNTYMSAFPLARSVSAVSGGVNGHTAQPLVETSPASWAETDLKDLFAGKEPTPDDAKDKKGPINLGAAVSAASTTPAPAADGKKPDEAKRETRVVVMGDSDFASNQMLGLRGNRDFFMNILAWLTQQENLISVRPREPDDRRIAMTDRAFWTVGGIALLGVPLIVFGTGVFNWWRRR